MPAELRQPRQAAASSLAPEIKFRQRARRPAQALRAPRPPFGGMPTIDGTWALARSLHPLSAERGPEACPRPSRSRSPSSSRSTARAADAASNPAHATASRWGPRSTPGPASIPVVLDLENCSACGLCMSACPEPYGLAPEPGTGFELVDPATLFGPRPFKAEAAAADPRRAAAAARDAPARDQGHLRVRDRRASRGLPALLRVSHHPVHGGRGADGEAPAEARRRLRPGGERGGHRQHDVRLRRGGAARR